MTRGRALRSRPRGGRGAAPREGAPRRSRWYTRRMRPLPATARVLIIGGGFAGASTAYWLARLGVDGVVVVEREETCGVHASGRNAALGRQLTEDEVVTDLAIRGAAFLRSPPAGFAEAPLLSRCGSVLLCDDDAALDALAARAHAAGIGCERVGLGAVAARWPLLAAAPGIGGLHVPSDGVIDVHALLSGFVAGARRGGAALVTGCAVTAVRPGAGGAVVETSGGRCEAEVVVNAAGAWVSEVAASAGVRGPSFTPIQRHLFVTEPVELADPAAPFVWHIGRDAFYLRREGRGLLVSACDETASPPCDARVAPDAIERLAAKLLRVAPALGELGVARAWACLRTFAADRRPVLGWDEGAPGFYWVAGLGGHGATASAAIGERAAGDIAARL